jgi:energy-converting hydrogenase B subunit D
MEQVLTFLLMGFDAALALTALWVAWHLLATRDLFKAVVLFIAFGLLMALIWVRFEAPDVALAEAAIGAGLTGALFLSALSRMRRTTEENKRGHNDERQPADATP